MTDYVAIAKEVLARRRAEGAATGTGATSMPAGEIREKSEITAGEAALIFVNRAGARFVAACPICHGVPAEARCAILVPATNDGPEFRHALAILKLDHFPIVARHDPLAHLPVKCEHVEARR